MPASSSQVSSGIMKQLAIYAAEFANMVRRNIDQNGLSEDIKSSIEIGNVESKNNSHSVEISIGKGVEGLTLAFEYGSGEHATMGTPGRYYIYGNPLLAIPRERWESYVPPPDVDPVIRRFVRHPGVEPQPFVQPATEEIVDKMKQELGAKIKAEILIGTERITVIRA